MLDALAVVMSAAVVTGARFAPSAPVWFTRERPIRTAVCDRERTAPGWHFQPVADVVEFARQITAAARMEEIVRLGHSADLTEIVDACSVLTHGLLPASSLGATLSPLGEEGTLDIAANILTAWFDHASSLFGLVATTRFSRSARAAWRIRGSDLSTRSLAALLIQSAGGTIDSGPLCRECKQPFRPVAGERKCPACPPLTNAQRQRKTAANETPEHRAARQQKERDQRRQTREAKRAERVRPGSPSGIPGPSERP